MTDKKRITSGDKKSAPSTRGHEDAFCNLVIQSPKRTSQALAGWDGFFPYYAGYPEIFARSLLESATLPKDAVVYDPWNGSGTTTYSAARLGFTSHGSDLNPVMIIIARARLLPPSEADSIVSLAADTIKGVRADVRSLEADDPLLWWFNRPTASAIRALERRIRRQLVGDRTVTADGLKLENISGLAATFYVALFSVCRHLTARYQSSNPTWLRRPKAREWRVGAQRADILSAFVASLESMAAVLALQENQISPEYAQSFLKVADATKDAMPDESVDLILTSPPYCTRIDYSAATRIELAILHPLLHIKMEDLGRQMIGSTRVPDHKIAIAESWGTTCARFLRKVKRHPSKASSGYYLKTHLDYFEKMSASLGHLSSALKPQGAAILVVQDSYYKDVHNDLPTITTEMAQSFGLKLKRREDFRLQRSMAGINPYSRTYKRTPGALEAVLCFEKIGSSARKGAKKAQ
jgi:hypothetical protein